MAEAPEETTHFGYVASPRSAGVNGTSTDEAPTAPFPRVEFDQPPTNNAAGSSSAPTRDGEVPLWPPRRVADSSYPLAQMPVEAPRFDHATVVESNGVLDKPTEEAPTPAVTQLYSVQDATENVSADAPAVPTQAYEIPVWPPVRVSEPSYPLAEEVRELPRVEDPAPADSGRAVEEPIAEAVEEPIAEAVEEPIAEAVEEPIAEAVEEPIAEAPAAAIPEPWPAPSSNSHRVIFACLAAAVMLILLLAGRHHRR